MWSIFHDVILPYILKTIWYMNTYFGIMSQYDLMFDLKIFVGCCDLYLMVQWFCLISWKLCSGWTLYLGTMSQYEPTSDLKIFVGHYDLYFMVHWICLNILKTVWCMNIILWDYESVWPQNKCRSLWPLVHGPVILLYILNNIWWMTIIILENQSV